MAQVLLIDSNYLKSMTAVNGSVDDNLVYPSVYLAQDKYIEQYTGTDLLTKIKTDVAGSGTTGNYTTLLNDYIRPALVWWTMVELAPNLQYRMDNGTLVQRQSEDAVPISDSVMKDMIERFKQNAIHYTRRMVDYLCHNSTLFPEYTSNQFPDTYPARDVAGILNYGISNGHTAMSNTYNWPIKRLSQLP